MLGLLHKNHLIYTGSMWDIHIHGFYIIWRVVKIGYFRHDIHIHQNVPKTIILCHICAFWAPLEEYALGILPRIWVAEKVLFGLYIEGPNRACGIALRNPLSP